MKKILSVLLIIAALISSACNNSNENKGGDPKKVLTDFFDAMAKKDMVTAKKLSTAESKSILDMWEMKMTTNNGEIEKYDKSKVEISEAKISGDNATVTVKDKASGESVNFPLQKEGGSWKVAFTLGSLMRMGIDKMNEKGINLSDSLKNVMNDLKGINLDSLQKSLKVDDKTWDSAAKILEGLKK